MGLILKKDVDVGAFRNKLNQAKGKIEKHRLGDRVLNLALEGYDTAEIAGVLCKEGDGVFSISQPTVSRWINGTGLFETRSKRGTSKKDFEKEVRRIFVEYQKSVLAAVEAMSQKHQEALIRTVKKISWKRGLSEILDSLEVKSDERKKKKLSIAKEKRRNLNI